MGGVLIPGELAFRVLPGELVFGPHHFLPPCTDRKGMVVNEIYYLSFSPFPPDDM